MAAREYKQKAARLSDVIARLQAVPRYLADVQGSLAEDVQVFRAAAKDDGEGLIDYLEHDLIERFQGDAALKRAVADAVKAVRSYLTFVERELPKKPKGDWRLGAERYEKRFRPYLQTDRSPSQIRELARRRLAELHREMGDLALKIVGVRDIRRALDRVAADHPAPEALFASVRKALADATAFVREKRLVSLLSHDNLQVVETPPFMRSQLGVAAFDGAPPLQPALGAFYYVTPFPKDWPKEKVESKLREYNRFMLDILTIHEAMPGHYVQFEHANGVQPPFRRLLRWLLGAGSYIEGWAVYAQDLLVDAGYRGGDPRLRLTARKMELRAVANAILDIELHTANMSDEAAMKLMTADAFQERAEAEAKLRRAKLSVTQLCSYFVGGEAWKAIRAAAERRGHLDLQKFHDRALGEGPVTLPTLETLLSSPPAP
jgi:uncharacterized protein (DUF885 family)